MQKHTRIALFTLCIGWQCLPAWAVFIPNLQEKPKKTSSPAPVPVTDPLRAELIFWSSIQDSTDPREFKAYLKKHPKGQFAEVAKIRIEKYTPVVVAPTPAKTTPVVVAPTPVMTTPVVTLTTETQEAYTKLDANGKPLPKSANHWDCVLDKKTKLIWEEKTNNGGLRDKNWTYTWFDPNKETNGGSEGFQDRHEYENGEPLGKSCGNTLSSCNTMAYVDAVNKNGGICGHSNWKMPTVVQLKTLITSQVYQHPFASFKWPIHSGYFRSLPIDLIGYWSSLAAPGLDKNAWIVALHNGYGNFEYKSNNAHIRLVYVGE